MMTHRQKAVLDFIQNYHRRNGGISPSYGEIAAGLGLKSKSSVKSFIDQLESGGWLRRLSNRARAIEVVRPVDNGEEPNGDGPDRVCAQYKLCHIPYRIFRFDCETKELVDMKKPVLASMPEKLTQK